MSGTPTAQLGSRYQGLRRQLQSGQLTPEQFASEVQRLQAQDPAGIWWTIDPSTGGFLRYQGDRWVRAGPPVRPARPGTGCLSKVAPVSVVVLPIFSGLIWFVYSSLSPSSESWDCLTPLILTSVPLSLVLFQKPIDLFLSPFAELRRRFPKPLRLGIVLALPVVLGLLCSLVTTSGYGAMRLTSIVGMVGAHVILRDPKVG